MSFEEGLINLELGHFVKNFINEVFGLPIDEVPCFHNKQRNIKYFHLSNAECGDGYGAKCHQVKRMKNNPLAEFKPGQDRLWLMIELGERMFITFRTKSENGSIDSYDKIIPTPLHNIFRETGKRYEIYYNQPVIKVLVSGRSPVSKG